MASEPLQALSAWDYVVFTLVLAVSVAIGIYYGCTGGKQKTTNEFLMANRNMSIFPVTLSLLASFMSAITLLGTPAEIYVYGTEYWFIWLAYCIVMPMAAHLFIPIFFNLELTSVFEYLELRFSPGIRKAGAVIYIVQMVMYLGIVLYTPSLALAAVTGFNVWIAVISVGTVCTFYTTLGGMKAVMWTDVFQICMMFIGLIAILISGSINHGGFANIWQTMNTGERISLSFNPSPLVRHSFWSLTLGGAFTWLSVYAVNQAQVQRALCVSTLKDAQIAIWLNLPGLTALLTICSLCGMVIYAQYKDCDPLTQERIAASDQLLPLYVMDVLNLPGLPGLFTASLFSAALSTISSALNSLATVTLKDIVKEVCCKKLSENRATLLSKCLALGYGIIMILLSYVASHLGAVLQAALGLFGMIGGPLLGLYSLGIFYPWANSKGASVGLASGLVITLWIGIGAQIYKPYIPKAPVSVAGCAADNTSLMLPYLNISTQPVDQFKENSPGFLKVYEMSYLWYSGFAVLVVHIVGLTVSFITGPNIPAQMDHRLISPVFYKICFCCSKSWSGGFGSGTDSLQNIQEPIKSVTDDLDKGYVNPAAEADIDVSPYSSPITSSVYSRQFETSV